MYPPRRDGEARAKDGGGMSARSSCPSVLAPGVGAGEEPALGSAGAWKEELMAFRVWGMLAVGIGTKKAPAMLHQIENL